MRSTGIMKSSLEEKEEILNTSPYEKNILPSKENGHLFNHIRKLSSDHDVSVSNTMIKVTYKKALKDHYASCNGVEFSKDPILVEDEMNSSSDKAQNQIEASEIVLLPKNVTWKIVKRPECDSSTNQNGELPFKKRKEHVNGLNVLKVENLGNNNDEALQKNLIKMPQPKAISPNWKNVNNEEESQCSKVKLKSSIANNNMEGEKSQKNSKKNGRSDKKKNEEKKVRIKRTEVICKSVKRKLLNNKEKVKRVKVSEKSLAKVGKGEKSNMKKPIMLVDPELPSGWSRYIRTRDKGSPNEKHIVYVVSPQGKKFRFKWKLRKYLKNTNSKLDPDQFFFGLYKRGKSTIVPDRESKKKSEVILCPAKANSSNLVMSNSCRNGFSKTTSKIVRSGHISKNDKNLKTASPYGRELLLYDPDLPFGWKRTVNSNNSSGQLQVHIISPEGRIFRRKCRLDAYLKKHQYTHNLDRFHFGLYPRKDSTGSGSFHFKNTSGFNESSADEKDLLEAGILSTEPDVIIEEEDDELLVSDSSDDYDDDEENSSFKEETSTYEDGSPMYDDPNLPDGWKRYIKTRTYGETAGRMEVVIVSPDGRKHRTRRQLEHYFQKYNQDYNAEDFDFTLFGKTKKRALVLESKDLNPTGKKKFLRPVPNFDVTSLKEQKVTPEGKLINAVNGLMIACDLSTARSERRSRLRRREHEELIRKHLESENDVSSNGCDIPAFWIEKFAKCRSDLRTLESDAISAIAEKTKDFIKEICQRAFQSSRHPEEGLQYEDVANIIENSECLSPLKTIIPKKITFKEFLRLNRPKQFLSFT